MPNYQSEFELLFEISFRLVNDALKEEMPLIHALTQKCVTPEQWEKMVQENPGLADKEAKDKKDPNMKCLK